MKQGDCQQAAQRFEESQRLDPASGTLLNLAYCQTQLGKTASAWLAYRQAVALAERTGKPLHAQLAREQGELLQAALPKLRFVLIGDADRLTLLKLDDEAMAKESWSLAVPVDPGPHRVLALFDTGASWEGRFVAQPGQESVVEVEVPQAEPAAAMAVVAPPASTAANVGPPAKPLSPPPAPPAAAEGLSGWVVGLGLAGAGAVVAGTALFVSARVSYDEARDHCSAENVCSDPYYEQEQAARSRSKASFILAGSGVLLLGAAAVLHFGANAGGEPQSRLSAALLGPRDFAAAYTRSF